VLRALRAALIFSVVAAAWSIAAAAWWTAAPAWGGGPLAVVATSTDLKALLEEVGGERVRVEALAPPGQDPHTVEVTPGRLAALQGAALVVRVGLDHEPWLAAALRTLRGRRAPPADLDCSKGIALLQTETARVRTERGEHVHGFGNTHYWLDPENARPITAAMVAALGQLAPEDRAGFESRRAEFLRRLEAGLTRWRAALAPYRGAKVVVVHESWPYFASRFGLQIVAAVEPTPGVPPSPASLASLIRQMKQAQVRVLIAEPYASASLVDQVAARSGARIARLAPSVGADLEARDYIGLFDLDVKRLVDAFSAR
jgi:ABC-type Zn uptake system ZnuABC Zn-binding protein ZnuA